MTRPMTLLLLALLATLLTAARATRAQCGEWDNRFGVPLDMNGTVFALTTWDPDGEGPLTSQLVAGGEFTIVSGESINRIARWDGSRWQRFGDGMIFSVFALTTWDPDGEGPQAAQLVAGGSFTTAGGVTVNSIARWDGSSWRPFGTGMNGVVNALVEWDPDGEGPQPSELVAGGEFTTAGGVTVNRIARWNGSAWTAFETGMDRGVYALTTWDSDGEGPLPSQLVAGGGFGTAGGVTANAIACWDGLAWQSLGGGMGAGFTPDVRTLETWDPDGDGPIAPQLVAGGLFTTSGGVAANNVARWDGSAWNAFGTGTTGRVRGLTVVQHEDARLASARLVAVGNFPAEGNMTSYGVIQWNGSLWQPLGNIQNSEVHAVTTWDPDAAGSVAAQVVSGGRFTLAGNVAVNRIARWDGSEWRAFDTGTSDAVHSLLTWDPDKSGPEQAELVAGGTFRSAGGTAVNFIARYDGSGLQPLGSGMNGDVRSLTTWDQDGDGPLLAQLVAGGSFTTSNGVTTNHIASWDGHSWRSFGTGLNGAVLAVTSWDSDGSGPQMPQLVAGGFFTSAGGVPVNRIARWDGGAWHPIASGVNDVVHALATWDPDGSGPLFEQLVVAGAFTFAGNVEVRRIARWDGAAWQPFGFGTTDIVRALATWDPDGTGPLSTRLVAGGRFGFAGEISASRIAQWDGAAWQPFGTGMSRDVYALSISDPDGDGPMNPQLIAGGEFITAGGVSANYLARWTGTGWQAFAAGMNGLVLDLAMWDPDGAGPLAAQLVAGGNFTQASGLPAGYIALWSTLPPEITTQPLRSSIVPGAEAQLTVAARNGQPTYQWRKAGINLSNGPTGSGAMISGATSPTLTITAAQPDDAGLYDCLITNSCGSTASDAVTLTVTPPSCPGDANGDNQIDGADLSVILENWNQPVPAGTSGDINNDGIVNGADLSILLATFGSSC